MDDYFKIGRITKAHGITGELKIKLLYPVINPNNFPDHIFVSDEKGILPYFIEKLRPTKHPEYIIKFEEIDTKSKADKISNLELLIESGKENEFFNTGDKNDLSGYQIFSSKGELIGQIEEVLDMPAHPTFSLQYKGRNVMLPQVDDLIVQIDHEQKKIIYELPLGILDI